MRYNIEYVDRRNGIEGEWKDVTTWSWEDGYFSMVRMTAEGKRQWIRMEASYLNVVITEQEKA